MSVIDSSGKESFLRDVEAAAKKAIWCALATVANNEARVRMVHPTWEGDILWIATGPNTAKALEELQLSCSTPASGDSEAIIGFLVNHTSTLQTAP